MVLTSIYLTGLFSFFLKIQTIHHRKFRRVNNCLKIYPKIDWKTLYGINLILLNYFLLLIVKLLEICDGTKWLFTVMQEPKESYGTITNPGQSCKDILEKTKTSVDSGIYWIQLRGMLNEYKVIVYSQN